jgi:sulfotransferase family protein
MMIQGTKKRFKTLKKRTQWHVKAMNARVSGLKGSEMQTIVFVTGVQRSGTNMLMQVLERHPAIDVYHEGDSRAFDNYEMHSKAVIQGIIQKSPFPIVTIKALLEGHDLLSLMDYFKPAKAIWMFRHYDDVVNSSLKNWPGWRNKIEEVIKDRDRGDWRGLGMTDETYRILKDLYSPNMDDASVNALFWMYRNQLFFDQKLDLDDRILLVSYEWLVQNVDAACSGVTRFFGASPDSEMGCKVSSSSIGKNAAPEIIPGVRSACDEMLERLNQVWKDSDLATGKL